MSRHQRLNEILAMLSTEGRLDVEQAAEALGVSTATVRRDFDHLAQQQLITRTHGGAVSTSSSYDLPLQYKIARQAKEKQRIAAMAAAMVRPGDTVALNGGTTTNEVARAIASRADLAQGGTPAVTVVTNALNIATELAVRPHVKIVVIGGTVRPQSYEVFGPLAMPLIGQLNVDIAFLGVDAVSARHGASAHHEGEASTNRALAAQASKVVVVADATKVGQRAFARICGADEVDTLVTDAAPQEQELRGFEEGGVEVAVAG